MVDINHYSSNLDYCLSQFSNEPGCEDLSLEGIDCLENINENEFLNFDGFEGVVDPLQQYSSLLPETPPETPINYLNHNSNGSSQSAVYGDSPPRSASNSFSLATSQDGSCLPLLDSSGSYSPGSNSSSSSSISSCHNSHQNLNFAIAQSPPALNSHVNNSIQPHQAAAAIISHHPTLIIPQSTISSPTIVIPSLVNVQPVLASVDLNGGAYQLATTADGTTTLVYSAKSIDSSRQSVIQPKPIQISPKQTQYNAQSTTPPHRSSLLNKNQTLEARKLRNREAALNSRMKKKEYVENLEENVKSLTKERDDLREENKQLRVKVGELETKLYGKSSSSSRPTMDINGNYGAASKRAKMSYFAVAVMICLQVSPYLIPGGPDSEMTTLPQSRQLQGAVPLKHTGRTLLWKRDTAAAAARNDDDDASEGLNANVVYTLDEDDPRRLKAAAASALNSTVYSNMTKSVLCKDYLMNRTESMRLESELRDWFTRFQLEEKQQLLMYRQQLRRHRLNKLAVLSAAATGKEGHPSTSRKSTATANKRLLFDSKYVPIPRLKLWMTKQNGDYDDLSEQFDGDGTSDGGAGGGGGKTKEDRAGSQVESLFGLDYQSLLATIHRRDDTFYYLSYPSKGHLILPPISNRSDVRPRFSFLIPTFHNLSLDEAGQSGKHRNSAAAPNLNVTSNSSDGEGGLHPPQMFILQIDCQVINTKVTLINDDRFGNKTAATAAAAAAATPIKTEAQRRQPRKAAASAANNSGPQQMVNKNNNRNNGK